jgi:hypothetical protein
VVGSSNITQLGPAAERRRDHHALLLAARGLVRDTCRIIACRVDLRPTRASIAAPSAQARRAAVD